MADFTPNSFRYTDASNNGVITMPTRNQIHEALLEIDESALLLDGFDEAFIGLTHRINHPVLAVYSWEKMVDVLVERDEMEYEDAVEYIDFNVLGAWVGEGTPIVVMPINL